MLNVWDNTKMTIKLADNLILTLLRADLEKRRSIVDKELSENKENKLYSIVVQRGLLEISRTIETLDVLENKDNGDLK